MMDKINHPPHYTMSDIEPIDVIEAWNLNYPLGNVIKYIARAEHKGSPVEDLEKAAWYLARAIEKRKELIALGVRTAAGVRRLTAGEWCKNLSGRKLRALHEAAAAQLREFDAGADDELYKFWRGLAIVTEVELNQRKADNKGPRDAKPAGDVIGVVDQVYVNERGEDVAVIKVPLVESRDHQVDAINSWLAERGQK